MFPEILKQRSKKIFSQCPAAQLQHDFLKKKSVSLTEVTILLKSVRMMRKNPLSLLFFLTKAPPLPLLLSKELNKQQRNTVSFIILPVCDFLLLFLICQVKSYHNYYVNKKHRHRMYLLWRVFNTQTKSCYLVI